MAGWPDDWRQRVLRASGIPVSQFALDILSAWRKSTPMEPWTNNPLGYPYTGSKANSALNTPYAAFVTIGNFADAMKRLLKSNRGTALLHELISANSLASTWREIHALKWPASLTETDYPSVLLDMVEEQYRTKLQTTPKAERRGTGSTMASPAAHEATRNQGLALHHAATAFADGKTAISYIMRRLG